MCLLIDLSYLQQTVFPSTSKAFKYCRWHPAFVFELRACLTDKGTGISRAPKGVLTTTTIIIMRVGI